MCQKNHVAADRPGGEECREPGSSDYKQLRSARYLLAVRQRRAGFEGAKPRIDGREERVVRFA